MYNIVDISNRLINAVSMDFVRSIYYDIDWSQKLIWIVWQRWVWKTTLILQYLRGLNQNDKIIYFSADNVWVVNEWLFNIVNDLYLNKWYRVFAIDEIHKYKNWNQELKNIYDSFVDIKVVFSWSSSIDLIKWKYDLSRRINLIKMQWFSFREYVNISKNINISKYSLQDIISKSNDIASEIYKLVWDEIILLFNKYIESWYYPFYLESDSKEVYFDKIWWIIDKLIYEDISSFYSLDTDNLEKFKCILMFYAFSYPWELSINALRKKLSLAYDTTVNYLQILNEIWVMKSIYSDWFISTMIRKASKIYLDNTNIMYFFNISIWKNIEKWTIREVFFVNHLIYSDKIFYSTHWDFISYIGKDRYYFEVWWKNKKWKQIKWIENSFLIKDNIVFPQWNQIPLRLFWFTY